MSRPRLYCPDAALGGEPALPDDAAHHARVVLRLRPGDEVRVFDGRGCEYAATLGAARAHELRVRVDAELAPRPESPLHVVLALAPLKGDRMEWALQKAVELGVAELRPVVTARTDPSARRALAGARDERWRRVTVSAAEQCGRAKIPALAPTVTLADLLAQPFEGARLLACERPSQPTLSSLERATRALALVGPEGGWEDAEIDAALAAGFSSVSLGPRILRAETAGVAFVAALQVLWGDLA